MTALLDGLNPQQQQAVEALEGPLLILAGAGTGKTRALTTRIANILHQRKAWPSEILALTFTNKAAQEMKSRIHDLVGFSTDGLWIGTFHSIGAKFLRLHGDLCGLKNSFTIIDTDDQNRLLKQLMDAEDIDSKKYPPRFVVAQINRWKDRGLLPEQVTDSELPRTKGKADSTALGLYTLYQERLKVLNAVDFGDLNLLVLTLFKENPDLLARYHEKFKYILVDEYQDTNVVQYLLLRLLAQGSQNICCVGDDDQSIYRWRGAEVGNILRFEEDFPGAQLIRLEQNYRSTPAILGAASALISYNKGRLGKSLWTQAEPGEPVTLASLWDGEEEARWVGDEIETLQRRGTSLQQMAILVRASFQTRTFEERFLTLGIPYRVVGGPRFYERLEIRDALAYLRLVAQPNDSLAFERVVNVPKRGIGASTLHLLHHVARVEGISLAETASRLVETEELRGSTRKTLKSFVQNIFTWHNLAQSLPPGELARRVLDESGYTTFWQQDKSPDAPGRLENLKELVAAIDEFDSLVGFLEHVSLVMDATSQQQQEMVTLMTLHGAKGLEFDVVFLAGWEEGLFPHPRALEEEGLMGLEEERRLGYVGLTRARQKAYITYAARRKMYKGWEDHAPSQFVLELRTKAKDFLDSQESWGRKPASPTYNLPAPFAYGDRVFHMKFGYGTVKNVEGDKIDVDFDLSGPKRVMRSFLQS